MQRSRRRLLAMGAGAPLAVLAGCGFRLREAPTFAFDSIAVNAPANSPIARELKRQLASTTAVTVLPEATPPDRAQVILDVSSDQQEKAVVGLNATGQVREFQLRTRVRFRLRTPQGRDLIPETELLQTRDVSFTETAALAKESEEQLLYRDMRLELAQQLMRRMAAVKGI